MDKATQSLKKGPRMALGRGLSALVSSAPAVPVVPQQVAENTAVSTPVEVQNSGVTYVDVARLSGNPEQPRHEFSEAEITELSESIKALGVLQPILVRPWAGGYQIIAGERRFRAAIRAGLFQVPVMIKELNDRDTFEVALVENVQRLNLNPLEEAKGYQRLMDEFNLSANEVAEKVGKDRATVANLVRVLKLPQVIQEMLKEGKLTVGHAKAILTVKEPAAQENLANKVIEENLSVRALEAIVSREVVIESSKKVKSQRGAGEIAAYPELEERLRNALGTKVSIKKTKQGGTIELHYFSDSELDRLVDILNVARV